MCEQKKLQESKESEDVKKLIRRLAEQGKKQQEIADELNYIKLFNFRGKKWSQSMISEQMRRLGIRRQSAAPRNRKKENLSGEQEIKYQKAIAIIKDGFEYRTDDYLSRLLNKEGYLDKRNEKWTAKSVAQVRKDNNWYKKEFKERNVKSPNDPKEYGQEDIFTSEFNESESDFDYEDVLSALPDDEESSQKNTNEPSMMEAISDIAWCIHKTAEEFRKLKKEFYSFRSQIAGIFSNIDLEAYTDLGTDINEKSVRSVLVGHLKTYGKMNNENYKAVTGGLYKEFYMRYGIDLKLRAKNETKKQGKDIKPLDIAEVLSVKKDDGGTELAIIALLKIARVIYPLAG